MKSGPHNLVGRQGMAGCSASDMLPDIASAEDRLFAQVTARLSGAGCAMRRACLLGFNAEERRELSFLLEQFDISGVCFLPTGQVLSCVGPDFFDIDFIFVLLESFESIDRAVTELISLREIALDCRVILITQEIQFDDLGGDRTAICDATLYWPLTHLRFRACLDIIDCL